MEFNTTEDVHTIMKYKRQEYRTNGFNPSVATVDLDCDNSARLEEVCKLQAMFWLNESCCK